MSSFHAIKLPFLVLMLMLFLFYFNFQLFGGIFLMRNSLVIFAHGTRAYINDITRSGFIMKPVKLQHLNQKRIYEHSWDLMMQRHHI